MDADFLFLEEWIGFKLLPLKRADLSRDASTATGSVFVLQLNIEQ